MLYSLTLLASLKRSGREAAYDGLPLERCPYDTPALKQAWESGWWLGRQDRQEELGRGTHHSITYQKPRSRR